MYHFNYIAGSQNSDVKQYMKINTNINFRVLIYKYKPLTVLTLFWLLLKNLYLLAGFVRKLFGACSYVFNLYRNLLLRHSTIVYDNIVF